MVYVINEKDRKVENLSDVPEQDERKERRQ